VSVRVIHVAKASGISGSERHLLDLLPGLRARGYDVSFTLLHEGEPGARELARSLEHAGIAVDAVRLRAGLDPLAAARLVRLFRRTRPAIVHTHLVHADFHGLPAAALARVPVRVSTKHGFNPFRSRRAFALGDRTVARLAHVHIAISAGLARYLAETEGFAEASFDVVHYGIDAGGEPVLHDGAPGRFACVGRLIPIKGHATLLEALAVARRTRSDLELVLAGSGPLEAELRARVERLGLADAVRFAGHVAPVAPVVEAAAAVVVPSLGEGFGMVALEAMERGRAVVATTVGGLPEIVVDGETGLLVPPGDVEALAEALLAVAHDPGRARAMGARGRGRALAEFAQERCTERTAELYHAALEGTRR
jgi:glycosyltransferase involved in cell wall biosynthesis